MQVTSCLSCPLQVLRNHKNVDEEVMTKAETRQHNAKRTFHGPHIPCANVGKPEAACSFARLGVVASDPPELEYH